MRRLLKPRLVPFAISILALLLWVPPLRAQTGDFAWSTNNATIMIKRYTGPGGAVTIPSMITGLPVTAIAANAFSITTVTSVTIPDTVTRISHDAFFSCENLTNVSIGTGVTNIEQAAFYHCSSLSSVVIPGGVTTIGPLAFWQCTNLNSVYFKGDAPIFGPSVFTGASLATFYYLPGTTGWQSILGLRTAIWRPNVLTNDASFGVRTNQFGFSIAWAKGMNIAVDACTNLVNPDWFPLQTNMLAADTFYFSDAHWADYPRRFYRVRWP